MSAALIKMVGGQFVGSAGCYAPGGVTDGGNPSFHSRGRAIDIWIATHRMDLGERMFDWVIEHRNEIGLNEAIFNWKIWRADAAELGVRRYSVNPHTDHIHIAVNEDGANALLPWYQPARPLTPEELAAFLRLLEELDVEHGMVKDTKHCASGAIVSLDAWGGLHCSKPHPNDPKREFKVALEGTGYWPGLDNARCIVLHSRCLTDPSAPVRGWVQDLNGGLHPFAEAGTRKPVTRSAAYFPGGKQLAFDERN